MEVNMYIITYIISFILSIYILVWFFRGMVALWRLGNSWVCQDCGYLNHNKYYQCRRCGFSKYDPACIPKDKIICPNCSAINSSKNNYCNECGMDFPPKNKES